MLIRSTPVLVHRQVVVCGLGSGQRPTCPPLGEVFVYFAAESRGTLREPEIEIIGRDAAKPITQCDHNVVVHEAPGGIAVAQQHWPGHLHRRCNGCALVSCRNSPTEIGTAGDLECIQRSLRSVPRRRAQLKNVLIAVARSREADVDKFW